LRRPKELWANKRKNVPTAKWNPACIHPVIAAKYMKQMLDWAYGCRPKEHRRPTSSNRCKPEVNRWLRQKEKSHESNARL
jgi:hypothetical protein